MGTWYEQTRDKWTIFELLGRCVNAKYAIREDGTVNVRNNDYNRVFGWTGVTGSAIQPNKEANEGKLIVSFGSPPTED